MSSYNGSGGRGRGRGRGGGRGGPGGGRGGVYQGNHPKAKLTPCKMFTQNGDCKYNTSCSYAHIVRSHAQIELPIQKSANNNNHNNAAPSYNPRYNNYNQNQSRRPAVSSIALWEGGGGIKFFSGSHDGCWRLYNTVNGFNMEFENRMGDGNGKVECVQVASDFLFCGFEGISTKLPGVKVGMIHAWNLNSPQDPPLEFHMSPLAPYAHSTAVTCLNITLASSGAVISGSRDGTIRLWQFNQSQNLFTLSKTLHGHARQITGLTIVSNTILWSSSTDYSMRLWDLNSDTAECKHLITTESHKQSQPQPQQNNNNAQQQQQNNAAHVDAITTLLTFENELGKFVLSGSLDGTIKAWNGETAECLATENHNQGVVSMALNTDTKGNPIVLCGLEDGTLMIRNVLQTANCPAFSLLVSLNKITLPNNHDGPIQCIASGPSNTFYSGGEDGKLIVWQLTGDLGL